MLTEISCVLTYFTRMLTYNNTDVALCMYDVSKKIRDMHVGIIILNVHIDMLHCMLYVNCRNMLPLREYA